MSDALEAQVAVVGAGPTGAAAALALRQRGIEDVVLLDSRDFPRDKTCGSGLSPRAIEILNELEIWEAIEPIAYPINGLKLVTSRGNEARISAGDDRAAAICLRREFDYVLQQSAVRSGAHFVPFFNAKLGIIDDSGGNDRWVGVRAADGREVRARYTVVATGAHAKLTSNFSRKRAIHTIMGWWEGVDFTPHQIEMIWDDLVLPCYGWLFPETPTRVNIGITYDDDDKSKNARQLFEQFLDKHYGDRIATGKQIWGLRGFPIIYTYRCGSLSSPGRLIAGEAGRLTHPATGEGISQGLGSALFAADAIADILTGRRNERQALRRYNRRCARTFIPSFWLGRAFRAALHTPLLDWIVRAGSVPAVQRATARLLTHF